MRTFNGSCMEAPASRDKNDRWRDVHAFFSAEARDKEADVLILGDDHVAMLEQSTYYRENMASHHCLVFGIMGDTVDLVEWRLNHGESPRIPPKIILLSIGHNDVLLCPPSDFLSKLRGLVASAKQLHANAKIFVMKLVPIGRAPCPERSWVEEVNGGMEETLSGSGATVVDIDLSSIQNAEGVIGTHHLFDFLHLTQEGYALVLENVHVALSQALNP